MGDYEKSIKLLEKSLTIREKTPGKEHPMISIALNNIGSLYNSMGNTEKALASLEKSLEISEKLLGKEHPNTAIILDNMGSIFISKNDYDKAIVVISRALDISKKSLGTESFDTAITMKNLANVYQEKGEYEKAKELLEDALKIIEKKVGSEHREVATALSSLADIYKNQNNLAKATLYLEKALAIENKQLGIDHPFTASTIHELAAVYFSTKDYKKSEELEKKALEIREKKLGSDHPNTLFSIYSLAAISAKNSQWTDVYTYTSRLLNFNNKKTDSLKQTFAGKDHFDRQEQQQQTRNMLLHLKASHHLLTDKNTDSANVIPDALTALQLTHDPRNTQAMVLTALKLAGNDPIRRPQVDAFVAALHKRDKSQENYDNSFLPSPENTPEKRENLKQYLKEAEQKVDTALATLKQDWPVFNALIDASPLTIAEANQLLHPHEAILAYVTAAEESYLMVLRQHRTPTLHRLDITQKAVLENTKKLRQGLATVTTRKPDGSSSTTLPDFDLQTAYELHQSLIHPALSDLQGITHLIIVPDQTLQNLPFATLLADVPPTGDDAYRQAHWLTRDYSLSQLPSLASLRMVRRPAASPAPEPFIGFGAPALTGETTQPEKQRQGALQLTFTSRGESTLSDVQELNKLKPLPFTITELQALANQFAVDEEERLFLNDRATEEQLKMLDKAGILQKQQVLAFSTHALLANQSPTYTGIQTGAESGLVFTPPKQASPNDDGYLTASEASQLTLNADWVLLSACNTGVVENKAYAAANANQAQPDSGGLSSLAKSFFHAGSRNLLITQWNVFDPSGSQIVPSLFNDMIVGNKSQRLQQAMLKIVDQGLEYVDSCIREEENKNLWQRLYCSVKAMFRQQDAPNQWAHPYYWAPYVIVGDGV